MDYSIRTSLSPSSKKFVREQIEIINKDSLAARKALDLKENKIDEAVAKSEGERVIAVDLGGSKARSILIQIQNGRPKEIGDSGDEFTKVFENENGKGYIDFLREIMEISSRNNLKVGIATAGVVEGSKLTKSPNLTEFVDDLRDKYDSDISKLFERNVTVVNDAVAGALASVLEVDLEDPDENVIYFINGGGIGGAVISKREVWATEPGHVRVIDNLNIFDVKRECNMWDKEYVCIENVAASGSGIERTWYELTGEKLHGPEIRERYLQKDDLARNLYNVSAFICAHAIYGMGKTFGLWQSPMRDMVIFHGGIFNVPGYAHKIAGHVRGNLGSDIKYESTVVMKKNLSLYGAGILPLVSTS
jgi:predicted NBD/HSP70 family sugar kinase